MNRIILYLQNIRVADILDVLIVAFVIYKFMILIRATRAEQLTKGIVAIVVFALIINALNLYTMKWILNLALTYGILSVLIVFQPELRSGLEYIGRSNFLSKPLAEVKKEELDNDTSEIVAAVYSLARQSIGALIVIERNTGLGEVASTGTYLNADISTELLINIFIPNTPLHDGAVIVRGGKIYAAACILPLTENKTLSKELGTRHRAAIGISEKSDAMVLVVSEESGAVSVCENGSITRYVDEETLKLILKDVFYREDNSLFSLRRDKDDKADRES